MWNSDEELLGKIPISACPMASFALQMFSILLYCHMLLDQ